MKFKNAFAALAAAAVTGVASADVVLSEGFESVAALTGNGWVMTNESAPPGETSFFQGNPGVFTAAAGADNAYIAANWLNAADGGNISNWLLTPAVNMSAGMTLSYMVRVAGGGFLDTLEVRYSNNGASEDLSDFSVLLMTYSSDTDEGWVLQQVAIPDDGLGRIAFRYVVNDTSINGNYIGLDSVAVRGEVNGVAEPASIALLLLAAGGLAASRRRRVEAGSAAA